MLALLTAGERDFSEKSEALFQLLHSGEVENPWSVPLLETVWHSYCQGGGGRPPALCQDPPMELYLWYDAPPTTEGAADETAAFSTRAGPPGEKTVERVERLERPLRRLPSAALALTGEQLTLCAPAEELPSLDRRELEQFAALHQVRRIECGGAAAQWLYGDAQWLSDGALWGKPAGLSSPEAGRAAPERAADLPSAEGPARGSAMAGTLCPVSASLGADPARAPGSAAGPALERRPALVWSGGVSPLRERPLAEGAALSHRPRLDGIHRLLAQAYPGFSTPREFWVYDTSRRIRRGCAQILAAEDSRGRILATAGCYAAGKGAALISGVATHPNARRRGYGTALVTALASLLSADGKTVWIVPVDSYAQQLYTSIGFTLCGKSHCIFQYKEGRQSAD